MFSIRTVGGVSLFLFGTTFLWLTPVYAASGIDTSSAAWATAGLFATVTMIGFIVATWGLFHRAAWWEPLAIVSAVAGLATVVPFWVAAGSSGVTNPVFDVVIHALGSIGVLILLRVPRFELWVHGHVAAGR